MIMRSAQSARKSISFCLSCGAVSCLLINFSRSHDVLHSVSKYLMLWASSPKSALDARVIGPISEYKSVVLSDDSITMWHKWWSRECLCTVSLTSGTFAKYSIWKPFTGWPFKKQPMERRCERMHLNVRFVFNSSRPCRENKSLFFQRVR